MGKNRIPGQDHQDDQDNDRIPNAADGDGSISAGPDRDGDGLPDNEAGVRADPIIINR